MPILSATYENEQLAARVAEGLLASSFPPNQIYAFVYRAGKLCRAPVGKRFQVGYGATVAGALLATLGTVLSTDAATAMLTPGFPTDDSLRSLAGALVAATVFGVLGLLLGALAGTLRFARRSQHFPMAGRQTPAFIGVRVSEGTEPLARCVLELKEHTPKLTSADDPLVAARRRLEEHSAAPGRT